MTKRRSTLTGAWSGAYRYPGDASPETVFNAQLEEVGGAFVGSTQEPNTFSQSLATVLIAEIEGVRVGSAVTFSKFYNDAGIRHAVRYEGAADEALTRIEGQWSIPGQWSGTFFMTRDDDGEAVAEAVEAEAVIGRRT
jgi:hypothetical protein